MNGFSSQELVVELKLRGLLCGRPAVYADVWVVHETDVGSIYAISVHSVRLLVLENSHGKFAYVGINGGTEGFSELRFGWDVFESEAEARSHAELRKVALIAALKKKIATIEGAPVR